MNEQTCMLLAGEASGDILAAELVHALKRCGSWRFCGAGGPRMAAAGVSLEYDLTQHAVVGVWEVLKHYPQLRRIFRRLMILAMEQRVDLIVLVDYPGFNLRYVHAIRRWIRRRQGPFFNWNPRIVYYVSPQIWAWHESRVYAIARDVDLLLSIFPFEKEWYGQRVPAFRVEYIGHPIKDRYPQAIPAPLAAQPIPESRPQTSTQTPPLILLLPGSRSRELKKHIPAMIGAAQIISRSHALAWRMVLPHPDLMPLAQDLAKPFPACEIQVGNLAESLAKTTLAIASSGTVTLECAYFGVPTIVIYRTSWLTYRLASNMIKVSHIAMPNLLAEATILPELIQNDVEPRRLAAEMETLLKNHERRAWMQRQLQIVIESLGPAGASDRAAQAIHSLWRA